MICIPFFHKGYKWRDILIFRFAGCYLLQGRKCGRCGKTSFRSPGCTGPLTPSEYNKELDEGQMQKAGLWDPAAKPSNLNPLTPKGGEA